MLKLWMCLLVIFWAGVTYAETATLTWNANSEADLAGYKVYRSTTAGVYAAPLATLGKVLTYNIALPAASTDTTYFMVIKAYDTSGNESAKSNEVSKLVVAAPVVTKPGVPVLTLTPNAQMPTSLSVEYALVSNGAGGNATVSIRYAKTPISWGSASSATCTSSPCVIAGLTAGTTYQIQAVASRAGTPNVFGALSAVISGTTTTVVVPPVDTDNDGTPDATDQCPTVAGPASNNGCPVPPVVTHCVTATTVSPSEITIKGVPCVN